MTDFLFGFLGSVPFGLALGGLILLMLVLGYAGAPFWLWALAAGGALWGAGAPLWAWIVWGVVSLLFIVRPLRRLLISAPAMKIAAALNLLPTIGDTERTALEAGTTWLEGDIFTGKLDFDRVLNEVYPSLRDDERAFLEGPTDQLCAMVDDWQVHQREDLPPEAWEFIKQERFFGMAIPQEYGGHGFSAYGMNAIIAKLGSRSIPLAVDVMVPNSLGPAELLINYGTQQQKDHYLPRLASGDEIPCFALTEPDAGTDAAALTSHGEVFAAEDGNIYIRLNWEKRYITLAPVATLLGLAFRLSDPDNLLGKGTEPGITLALVPTEAGGVIADTRHDPLHTPFINGPTEGHDVVIPVEQIIGGPEQAGNGWRMLMETLAVGRGIFIPAMNTGGAKFVSRVAGAYATVRQQFGLPIGRFEGVQELLTDIGGLTYTLDALSRFTCSALDEGAKPAVISAIAKYNSSEYNRTIINRAMDLLGGAGIMLGPRNLLGSAYTASPIAITVEGSNVVTRSLITFGQGLIRSHPFAFDELDALENGNVKLFDKAFWSHIGQVIGNLFRAGLLGLTRGRLAQAPARGWLGSQYRRLAWAAARFALLADVALLSLGGGLKIQERLSGRFADILSQIYIALAVLRRYEDAGRPAHEQALVRWSVEHALATIQDQFEALLTNFPVPWLRWWLAGPVALWARLNPISRGPADSLGAAVADALMASGEARNTLTEGIYLPPVDADGEPLATLERAFKLAQQALPLYGEIRDAVRDGSIQKDRAKHLIDEAYEAGVISQDEHRLLKDTEAARGEATSVDAFTPEEKLAIHFER